MKTKNGKRPKRESNRSAAAFVAQRTEDGRWRLSKVKTSSLAITTSVTPGNSSHGMPIFSFGGEGGTGGQLVDLVSSVLN